ncbi:MAG: hypothetical protein Q9163_002439 [Psora crenata]
MPKNGRMKPQGDEEFLPGLPTAKVGRKSKKQKVEEDICDKLAPGAEEGIDVKTKFPVARIKRIMQADEDVGKVSQVTPTAVSKALELFIISIVLKSSTVARSKSSKRVTAAHLKQAVQKDEQMDFLADIVAKVPDAPAPSSKTEGKKKGGVTEGEESSDEAYVEKAAGRKRKGGGTGGVSPAKKHGGSQSPQQRLIRFKKVHDQLQLIWRRNSITPPEPAFLCLQHIRQVLQNEVQAPAPHLCARHVSTFHIYTTIAQLAAIYPDGGIVQEALHIYKILLDSEEGDFLADKGFANALIGFIRTISNAALPVDTEAGAVEVLFAVSAKLRLQPQLLLTWFRPSTRSWALPLENRQSSSRTEEFPLFYLTLGYVHHDGKAGDFARTGLLYLIECAAHSAPLEQWIIESDLATLMASGLGALYSQLSRKLFLEFDEETLPPILSLSGSQRPTAPLDAEKSTSSDFKAHLATFLSYLVFWQDVLEHCRSKDVKQSLLDHFKFLFLQQLLYPSLVESSDSDGGSSVAVLTYLKCIIESIDHPELVQLTFEYLLAIPEPKLEEKSPSRPAALARRRRSQNLVADLAQGQEKPMPHLFNLDDLVLGSLRSLNQQTLTATLRLISTMLRRHHQYDVSLIKMGPAIPVSLRPYHVHQRNVATLFSTVEDLLDDPSLGDSYESHLEDAQNLLESHACSVQLLTLPDGPLHPCTEMATPSTIASTDPVLASLVGLLEDFFVNNIETNLSLTQVFSTIASCARRNLDGWLLENRLETAVDSPAHSAIRDCPTLSDRIDRITLDNQSSDEANRADTPPERDAEADKHRCGTSVFAALHSLVKQVETFRQDILNFGAYLSERRRIFNVGEQLESTAKNNSFTKRVSEDLNDVAPLMTKSASQVGSISERLLSEASTAIGSRSSSPRGRQMDTPSAPTLFGRLSHLRLSSSRSPSKSAAGSISTSPLRNGTITPLPRKDVATPMALPDALRQRIRVKVQSSGCRDSRSETSNVRSASITHDSPIPERYREVTLSHILTNVIILQEFVLELAAIVQVRASLFGEVSFA